MIWRFTKSKRQNICNQNKGPSDDQDQTCGLWHKKRVHPSRLLTCWSLWLQGTWTHFHFQPHFADIYIVSVKTPLGHHNGYMVAMLGVIYMDNGSDHHAHDFGDEKVILVTIRWKDTLPSPDEPILPKPSPLSPPFFRLSAFQLSQLCTHFLFVTIWGVTFQLIHFVHTS